MENEIAAGKIVSLIDFFKTYGCVRVPASHHGFVSEDDKWREFFNDLVTHQGSRLYLGQIVVEKSESDVWLIDGQQRLTAVSLVQTALSKIRSTRREDDNPTMENFQMRVFRPKEEDQEFFDNLTLKALMPPYQIASTRSQKQMIKAFKYFVEELGRLDRESLINIQSSLDQAAIGLTVVSNTMEAIESLSNLASRGNDRMDRSAGAKFETIKCFLLHRVYLNSSDSGAAEIEIAEIQSILASIYRNLEILEDDLTEDEIFECFMSLFYPQLHYRRLFENFNERFMALKDAPGWIRNYFQNYLDLLVLKNGRRGGELSYEGPQRF